MNTTTKAPVLGMPERIVQQIEKALEAGPTPGTWRFNPKHSLHDSPTVTADGAFPGGLYVASCAIDASGYGMRDAAFIAACNPENIRALLAALSAKQGEVERMAAENEKLRADLLPLQEFMDAIFGEFPDHGDIDGFDLQDIAEACGLLKKKATVTPCGEHCGCAENGIADGTEAQCYRIQPVMRRARIAAAKARAALATPTQGEQG